MREATGVGADEFSVVIVGAGQAGGRAARAMREAGFRGAITLIGEEPHPPYERPPLSKALLLDAESQDPTVLQQDEARRQGIELELGRSVVSIDRQRRRVRLDDGSHRNYDRLLLATGCRVNRLELDGFPPAALHHLRTLDDARSLERKLRPGTRLVVVGGGFIGLEVAASAQARGARVAVVETSDRLLPRLGCPEASAWVLRHHLACGLDIRLGARIASCSDRGLTLADGAELPADLVVAGIGVRPNDALASASGLQVDDGVITDEYGRSSDPDIFAAGDVTRHFSPVLGRRVRLETWQNANLQAEAAARTLVGVPTPHDAVPWVWSDQGALNIQAAGAPQAVDQAVVRAGAESAGMTVFQFHAGRLVGGVTLNHAKEMPLIRRMLADPGAAPDPTKLADASVPLRRLLTSAASA